MSDETDSIPDGDTIINLPGGARVIIRADGKVDVEGELDEDGLAIIQALDPDAAVACRINTEGPSH